MRRGGVAQALVDAAQGQATVDQLPDARADGVGPEILFAREIQPTWASVPAPPDKPTLASALAEPMRIADFMQPQKRREW